MPEETIPEFYAQQNILLTGATGFIGKLIIEKLLYSCPDLEKIYIIVRSKRNKSAQERWNEVTNCMAFGRLKAKRPGILEEKVHVVEGDTKEKRLALSNEDYKMLQDKITIIFHGAASVRFNDPLTEAIFINTRGTHEVVKLALGMKSLKVMIHVSTTYCNPHLSETEEILYPPQADWKKTIEICEKLDKRELVILSMKYLNGFPNTYIFSKNLTEALIWNYKDKLPLTILRPSIVIASMTEPIPGWIDNMYGPIGMLIAGGKGILRIAYCNKDAFPDYIPADVAVKATLIAAWKRAQSPKGDLPIYNLASREKGISNGDLIELSCKVAEMRPVTGMLWLPTHRATMNLNWFKLNAIILHLLPAIFVDKLLTFAGKKPMLLKIQQRVHTAMICLGYFTTRHWNFHNERFHSLLNEVLPADKEEFDFEYRDRDILEYFLNAIHIGKKTLLGENEDEVLPRAKIMYKRMYLLDKVTKIVSRTFLVEFHISREAQYSFGKVSGESAPSSAYVMDDLLSKSVRKVNLRLLSIALKK